jgi:hypothetical protein
VLIVVAALAASVASAPNGADAAGKAQSNEPSGHMLFCAYWSYGVAGQPVQANNESHFAVAVVEVDSPAELDDTSVSDLSLYGAKDAVVAHMRRLLKVENFDEPLSAGESPQKYYLNTDPSGHSRPWDGTLPAGKIRLRVSAAVEDAGVILGCRVTLGTSVIEGPVSFTLAT